MRTSFGPLLGLALALLSTPALAEDEETPAITISGGATLVSDYRFRGITQTDKDFAVQGTFTVSHKSGFYATVWGSSIDDYVAFGGDQEIDIIGGFKKTFGGTTVDVGVLYYYYPGAEKLIPVNTDFAEPYLAVSRTFGPVTGKVTAAYAPKQSGLDYGFGKEDGFYLAGDLSGSWSGFGLSGHLGHSFSRNYITGGQKYTDWAVGASYSWKNLTLGVQYVDTDGAPVASLTGKNIYKGGIVASLGVAF